MAESGFFSNRWWIVAASFSALLVGSGAINIFAFGVFIIPVTQDLGVSRGDFSGALAANGIATAAAVLFMGPLLDRFGVRRVLLPGILLCAAATFLYSQMTASLMLITAIFALAGFVGGAQTPMPYTTAVNQWFDRERGLALGIATAGVGLGVVLVPWLATTLMTGYGWRGAYMGLALAILVLAFIPSFLFIRNPPNLIGAGGRVSTDHLPGMTFGEILRSWRFWLLTAGFCIAVMTINGTITHVVAMLRDRGVPPQEAVRAVQMAGLAIIGGRLISGWFLDRIWGPFVAIFFFGFSILGMGILAYGPLGPAAVIGAMLCGAGIGAEIDLMGFLMSRYFGMRSFGKAYGLMFAFFNFGTGFGPSLSGKSYDSNHSYTPILTTYMVRLAVVCIALLTLGPYVYKPQAKDPS